MSIATASEWCSMVSRSALDHRATPLSDRVFRLLLILDNLAGPKPYCRPSNETLEGMTGKDQKTVQRTSREAEEEEAGLIHRVMTPGRSDLVSGWDAITGRAGFVLLWRPNDGPMATRDDLDQVIAAMLREREGGGDHVG